LFLLDKFFYKPLLAHKDWIEKNGIFSNEKKEGIRSTGPEDVNIIKGEKLKLYSVAEELLRWAKLKEDGHISEQEYQKAKDKLLIGS
jgi:hypothetical protein